MAFGYEYLMVYLPAFNRESFLLFVHNPAGSTKLRDYSGGVERVVGQPPLSAVSRATVGGETRFTVDAHTVSGDDGSRYWSARTREFNARYLGVARSGPDQSGMVSAGSRPLIPGRNEIRGRAVRGSQRQLQDYVNEHEPTLTRALVAALPPRLQELGASLRWVSPLARDDYAEYRDADFLRAVGLAQFSSELAGFWPAGGPSWDALAVVTTPEARTIPGIVMVEAKSHIPEIYGSGCQAGPHSRGLIEKSLAAARNWYGARPDADWTGALYQSANRLAYLYFIREWLKRPAWLVNLYFENDPYRPTCRDAWEKELDKVRNALGLTGATAGVIELYLPGLIAGEPTLPQVAAVEKPRNPAPASPGPLATAGSFAAWRDRWTALAEYGGPAVPDPRSRIDQVVRHWTEPIPGEWKRGADRQLHGARYRRGDLHTARSGEHAIEYEILCAQFDRIRCFGCRLLDGVNAFPLSRDTAGGGRRANVEADMLLLAEHEGAYRLFLCEVKDKSNDPWFATVESLRQLRLFLANPESQNVFAHRGVVSGLPAAIPVTALVLAPPGFYSSRGKKANALKPAHELIARCSTDLGADIRLAVWDPSRQEIRDLQGRAR